MKNPFIFVMQCIIILHTRGSPPTPLSAEVGLCWDSRGTPPTLSNSGGVGCEGNNNLVQSFNLLIIYHRTIFLYHTASNSWLRLDAMASFLGASRGIPPPILSENATEKDWDFFKYHTVLYRVFLLP